MPESGKSSGPLSLGKRERQIVETLYRLGEASVAEVHKELPEAPTYSTVRAMLNLLVKKGQLTVRHEGKRYLYKPISSKEKVRRSVLRQLVRTFFSSDPADAVAALIDGSAGRLSGEDLERIKQLIARAEQDKTV